MRLHKDAHWKPERPRQPFAPPCRRTPRVVEHSVLCTFFCCVSLQLFRLLRRLIPFFQFSFSVPHFLLSCCPLHLFFQKLNYFVLCVTNLVLEMQQDMEKAKDAKRLAEIAAQAVHDSRKHIIDGATSAMSVDSGDPTTNEVSFLQRVHELCTVTSL